MHTNDAAHRKSAYAGPLTQSSFWSRSRKPVGLNLVPMIDIFTVLVTFLLMTAVFSRITILQLDLPSSESTAAAPPPFRLEVIVREQGLELTNGNSLIATIPKVNGDYDLKALSDLALALKRDYPTADDASVLLERTVAYDYLIQVMDAIRSTELPPDEAMALGTVMPAAQIVGGPTAVPKATRVPLFTHIAVGDAP